MAASMGQKRKRPERKTFEEPLVIPCMAEELNHVLNKWIEDGIFKTYKVAKPPTEQERKKPIIPHAPQLYVRHAAKNCWTL